jgi:hypothetical protein
MLGEVFMTDLKNLDDVSLWNRTAELALEERKLTLRFLHHLKEIENRRLYLRKGFGSLYDYVKSLGYCETSTQMRISSMRLLRELPEIEEKIEKGSLSLSAVARAQTFFRKEQNFTHKRIEANQKQKILSSLEGQTTRQTEQTLLSISSNPEVHFREKKKLITPQVLEYSFFADESLQLQLEKIKGVLSHRKSELNMTELIRTIAEMAWEKLNPGMKSNKSQSPPAQEVKRTPSWALKRIIWQRDQGKCSHVDPKTGIRCNSFYKLELDHYPIPFAKGGPTSEENLRLVCKNHNTLHAVQAYGVEKMKKYWFKASAQ